MSTKRCTVSDLFALTSRKITDEGYLIAPGNLARFNNVQAYHTRELALTGDRMVRLFRPKEEVCSPATLASLNDKPLTFRHPPQPVTAKTWKEYAVGDVRDVAARDADEHVGGMLMVRAADAVNAILDGTSALSCGYDFDLDMTPGIAPNGEAYDGVMRRILANHHSIVDVARGGPGCRVADQRTGDTMALKKITVGDTEFDVEEGQAPFVKKLFDDQEKRTKAAQDAVGVSEKRATDAETALAAEKTKSTKLVADHEIALKAVQDKIPTEAQIEKLASDRAAVVNDALKLLPEFVTDGKTVPQIRTEVLTEVMAKDESLKPVATAVLKGADMTKPESAGKVEAAFSAIAAMKKTGAADGVDRQLGADLAGGGTGTRAADAATGGNAGAQVPKLFGRDLHMARNANGGKVPEANG